MNQDEVKAALVSLHEPKSEFTLLYSGKANKKVNGLYKPSTHEIVIHNRNFTSDNALFFTAMHEYAHHIMTTEKGATGTRSHTNAFWAVVHELASLAEARGLYAGASKAEGMAGIDRNLTELLRQSGEILKQIGQALIEAQKACTASGARFEDYVMRELKQTLPWAQACMKAAVYDLPSALGAENIKMVASIKSGDERTATIGALEGNLTPQQVKTAKASEKEPEDVVERLEKEKERIARTVAHLLERQHEVERELEKVLHAA